VSLQHNRELLSEERTHIHLREPAAWVCRFAPLIAAGGSVLDLASGYGRHARFLEDSGWRVVAVDRDAQALAGLAGRAGIRALQADVENGGWPCGEQRFAGIVVVNYLHRPLFPRLVDALDEGGVLIYETFMSGNERFGRPSNPEFLLRPDELLDVFGQQLHVVAFEQGEVAQPKPAMLQRLCAVRTADATRLRLPEPV
jgi:SAM-dependent methyltransferase